MCVHVRRVYCSLYTRRNTCTHTMHDVYACMRRVYNERYTRRMRTYTSCTPCVYVLRRVYNERYTRHNTCAHTIHDVYVRMRRVYRSLYTRRMHAYTSCIVCVHVLRRVYNERYTRRMLFVFLSLFVLFVLFAYCVSVIPGSFSNQPLPFCGVVIEPLRFLSVVSFHSRANHRAGFHGLLGRHETTGC